MIKLNNKNITYVALADSNNSVKGVKEIWYADSNNSVKLVYRRKDALIEGVDYEKYHWLDGDGSAYVQVQGFVRNENWEITTSIANIQPTTHWILLYGYGYDAETGYNKAWTAFCDKNATYIRLRRCDGTTYNDNALATVQSVNTIIDGHNSVTINGETFTMSGRQYGQIPEFRIFSQFRDNLSTTIEKCNFSEFVVKENDLQILDLVPCKLLKPVPKWLDANGIRRNIGECGMIDLVSGKFYGNVNSVGTFTVENYYERKEWLKGDGEAFINTLINPSFGDVISAEGVITSRPNIDNIAFISANSGDDCFGLYTGGSYHKDGIPQYVILHTSSVRTEYIAFKPQEDGKFKMQCQLTRNSLPQYSLSIDNVDVQPYVINATINQVPTSSYRIGYFVAEELTSTNIGLDTCKLSKVTINSHTLIPCTLTMDLPASMDANNTPRTKGTSGMWDLVSDRFYGNVASSGTFKAVNLAEGVDYEVYDWLVGDGNAKISVIGNIHRDIFSVVTIPTTTTNKILLNSNGTTYNRNTSEYLIMVGGSNEFTVRHGIRINNYPTAILKDFSGNYINNKYEITTYRDGDYYYGNINGVEYKNDKNFEEYQFDDVDIVINIYSNGFKLGNFNNGRINLIPVKLLKSIPSKYDANGIARQAGECGMYDTVNDKFYGNVASSGSFTVSDDN